ncbi:MAG: glycosyltransferase family 10 [Trichodesmium sp. MAG_R04]|jgi:hypothetical protein|nr:glycosyltransferase family 10 [Trichodesmium sp. MAG_R04]MDT9340537.1 glycosyltransferase family 10 [Trichodesmium erythraeum 21-75]
MVKKIYKADDMRHTPFRVKANHEFLEKEGFIFTDNEEECDLFLSRTLENLNHYIKKYKNQKKYLIWTHEPRYDTHFSNKVYVESSIEVDIMNTYTNEIYVNNYRYCNLEKMNSINLRSFERSKGKLIVILATCKNPVSLIKNGIELDLVNIRNNIAYLGSNLSKVEIYGSDWEGDIAIEDSVKIARQQGIPWAKRKVEIMKQYHFNLCFENTNYKYYCTEKIWQALEANCLPIYYGKGNAIYEDFPPNSFLDYSEFNKPDLLFEYINAMSIDEFNQRMNRCIATVNTIVSEKGRFNALAQQNKNIVSRLKQIFA